MNIPREPEPNIEYVRLACLEMHLFVLMAVEPGPGVDEYGGLLLFRTLGLAFGGSVSAGGRGPSVRGLVLCHFIALRLLLGLADVFHHA